MAMSTSRSLTTRSPDRRASPSFLRSGSPRNLYGLDQITSQAALTARFDPNQVSEAPATARQMWREQPQHRNVVSPAPQRAATRQLGQPTYAHLNHSATMSPIPKPAMPGYAARTVVGHTPSHSILPGGGSRAGSIGTHDDTASQVSGPVSEAPHSRSVTHISNATRMAGSGSPAHPSFKASKVPVAVPVDTCTKDYSIQKMENDMKKDMKDIKEEMASNQQRTERLLQKHLPATDEDDQEKRGLRNQLEHLQESCAEKDRLLEEANMSNEAFKDTCDRMEQTEIQLRQKYKDEMEQRTQKYQSDREKLNDIIRNLKDENANLNANFSASETRRRELQKDVDELHDKLSTKEKEKEQARDHSRRQFVTVQADNDQLKEQLKSKMEEFGRMHEERERMEREKEKLERMEKKLRADLIKKNDDCLGLSEKVNRLELQLEEETGKNTSLRNELQQCRHKVGLFATAKEQLEAMRANMAKSDNEAKVARAELHVITTERDGIKEHLHRKEAENKTLQEGMQKQKQKIGTLMWELKQEQQASRIVAPGEAQKVLQARDNDTWKQWMQLQDDHRDLQAEYQLLQEKLEQSIIGR